MTTTISSKPSTMLRSAGVWMGIIMVLAVTANAFRAATNPVAWATFLGTPLVAPEEVSFVYIYAIRSLSLAVLCAWLLVTRRLGAMAIVMFATLILAWGDAALTFYSGAAATTVGRHVLLGVYVIVAGLLLQRAERAGLGR